MAVQVAAETGELTVMGLPYVQVCGSGVAGGIAWLATPRLRRCRW